MSGEPEPRFDPEEEEDVYLGSVSSLMSTRLAGVPFTCQLVQAVLLLLHPHLQLPQLLPCLLQGLSLRSRSSLPAPNRVIDTNPTNPICTSKAHGARILLQC